MGILRTDRVSGLGGANAIKGSVNFTGSRYAETYFDIDASTDFAFGTGDFTIECWINLTHDDADNYYKRVYMTDGPTGNASGNFQIAIVPSTGVVNLWEVGSALDVSGSTKVTKAGWVHIAAVRSGSGSNNLKLYVDGVQDLQTTYTTSISPNSGNPRPRIGAYAKDTGGSLPGHVSNLRVSNEALYTSAFTRPTTELTKLSSTILLCFQSPGNIIKEETDKILVPNRVKSTSNFPTASHFTPNSPVGFSTTTDVGTQFGSTFDGVTTFDSQAYFVPPGGNTRERNRGRGVIRGGMTPNSSALTKIAQYIEMSSGGNTIDFGDGTAASYGGAGLASATRGVYNLGATANTSPFSLVNTMEFVTIANTANALDFGDLYFAIQHKAPMSNQTRGIFAAGISPQSRVMMSYITIATLGNSQDFGDSIGASYGMNQGGQAGSSTRGLIAGGSSNSAPAEVEKIQFVTFATLGDAQDFGDLVDQNAYFNVGASSGTRALFAGGGNIGSPFATVNTIQFVTIATTGNATDFGDLTATRYGGGALSNSTRGCFVGGVTYPGATRQNIIDFVNIATTGNAKDFGDIAVVNVNSVGTMSDSHGGLS